MPRAAAAEIASVASPPVSLPSERRTRRCWVPAGMIAAARRTAAAMSVEPTTGTEAGVCSSFTSDGSRSTSAFEPKTTTPARSPCGILDTESRAKSTSESRVAGTMEADPSTRKTTESRSDGRARRAPASTMPSATTSTIRMTSDAARRALGRSRAAASQPSSTTSSAGAMSSSQVGSVKTSGIKRPRVSIEGPMGRFRQRRRCATSCAADARASDAWGGGRGATR